MYPTASFPNISRLDGFSMTASTARTMDITPSSSNGHTNGQSKPHDLLSERSKTHGSFQQTARIAQAIKDVMRSAPNWHLLTDAMRESLEMDATKTARVLVGNPFEVDHWIDKEGYRDLVLEEIKRG
jgi:hypothetical protein